MAFYFLDSPGGKISLKIKILSKAKILL